MSNSGSYHYTPPVKRKDKSKQVLAHLKVWLLEGKSITQNQALRLWQTSRLAVYIHRLRRDYNMQIRTKIVHDNGDQFASYSLDVSEKKQRLL